MVKYQALRKNLIKISIIVSVLVLVSSVVAYSTHAWYSGKQADARRAQGQLNTAEGEVNSRGLKNEDARKYLELYRQITGESEQAKISDLSRDKAQLWLRSVANANDIMNLKGSFEPVQDIPAASFKKKTLAGIASLVKLEFGAMSDEQIFHFVQAILDRFPGYVKINTFTLERGGEITPDTLRNAGRGQFPELVKGKMEFYWVGVREVDPDAAQQGGR